MHRIWLILGSAACFASVAGGAFGAHALRTRLAPELLTTFETGARYAGIHGLALLVVGLLMERAGSRSLKVAGIGFSLGILLFTGSLWALALSGIRGLGAITPFGGLSFLVGWLALGFAARRWPGA